MKKFPKLIKGGKHTDERGTLSFVNDFKLDEVQRFYTIEHHSTDIVRAWQGHKSEQKWFYVVSGSFKILSVEPDNWETPTGNEVVTEFLLDDQNSQVLHIPGGYANGFQALVPNSKMIVFSNFSTEQSTEDDFRFNPGQWGKW